MEFPITELLDLESSTDWILEHFHPKGLQCPVCQKPLEQSREFRRTQKSGLAVQRCYGCDTVYNLYTGTVFQGCHWTPMQVVLLMRGICKGETTRGLSGSSRGYPHIWGIQLAKKNVEIVSCQIIRVSNQKI
jgi:hypothetical protein